MTRALWPWLRTLAGVGILAVLIWRLGTDAFLDGLRVIDLPALALAVVIGLVTIVSSAWRWCLVARGMGIRLPLGAAVADYYRAVFLNAALPGGVLGDVHRAVRHGQDVGDVGRGVRAVVMERFAGQLTLVVVGAVALLGLPSPMRSGLRPVTTPWGALAALAAVVAVAGLLGWLAVRRPGSWWGRTVRATIADVRTGLLGRGVWPGIALSSIVALAGHLATFVLAARVAGSSAPVTRLAPLLLLALLAMAIPVNVGGWGPREGATAWAFGAAGLGAAQGLTTSVVYGVLAFVAGLPGIAVLVLRWVARRRAARQSGEGQPDEGQPGEGRSGEGQARRPAPV